MYIYTEYGIRMDIITIEGVNSCCLLHTEECINSNAKIINGVAKTDKVTVTFPNSFGGEGMTLKDACVRYANNFTIEKAMEEAVRSDKSFKVILDLSDNVDKKYKWLIISYGLHLVNENSTMTSILPLLYDERVTAIDKDDILEELILKKDLKYITTIINRQYNSKEVIRFFLYKLLRKIFPDNKDYWIRYKKSRNVDKTKFIRKVRDWKSVYSELGIEFGSEKYGEVCVRHLIKDYFDNNLDFSNYKSAIDYYRAKL